MPQITWKRKGEYLQTAFKVIVESGGSYPLRDILVEMEKNFSFNDYEKSRYEKSGQIRWQSITFLYSIDCTKAGWLKKHKGVWSLTDEGVKSLEMDPESFIRKATEEYRKWREKRDSKGQSEREDEIDISEETAISYDQVLNTSRTEIENYINSLNPFEFQDLIAALLRGMGYYTPTVSTPGPDGGVDIIAYKDPLGAIGPRIKVQVKHRVETRVSRAEVASLNGVLKDGEIGLIVSSGGFSREAINEIRSATNHIQKIDLDEFINLWEEYYDDFKEEDKKMMPLSKISFLAPEE